MKAVLGIGTNIGDRRKNIDEALNALNLVPNINVIRSSSVYETAPWGFTEQRSFYNIVTEIETSLSPKALLGVCLGIEAAMGRIREFKNGPRIIDLDVLVYEGVTLNEPELTLPHPRIGERDFVLIPLKELYESVDIVGFNYKNEYDRILPQSSAKKVEKS